MKIILLLIPVLFLTSCTQPETTEEQAKRVSEQVNICASHNLWYQYYTMSDGSLSNINCIPINWSTPK